MYHCFVIVPSGNRYEGVLKAILSACNSVAPVVEIALVRADRDTCTSLIHTSVARDVDQCDFAIADLTDGDANVLCELGYVMGRGKPVILMASKGTSSPVPSSLLAYHFLEYDPAAMTDLPVRLHAFLHGAIRAVANPPQADSFVTSVYSTSEAANLPLAVNSARSAVSVRECSLVGFALSPLFDEVERFLKSREGVSVRVLAMDPDSPLANYRALSAGVPISVYRRKLRGALDAVSQRLLPFADHSIVRVCEYVPEYSLMLVDDSVFLGFPGADPSSRDSFTMKFRNNQPGVLPLLAAFESAWLTSTRLTLEAS